MAKEERKTFELTDSLLQVVKVTDVLMAPQRDAITLTGKVAFNDDNVAKLYPAISGNVSGIKVMLGDHANRRRSSD